MSRLYPEKHWLAEAGKVVNEKTVRLDVISKVYVLVHRDQQARQSL